MQQFYMHDGSRFGPWAALAFFLLVGAAVAVGVWLLVRSTTRHPYPSYPAQGMVPPVPPSDPALDILRLRFARGEIDADEYASRATLLGGGTPPPAAPS